MASSVQVGQIEEEGILTPVFAYPGQICGSFPLLFSEIGRVLKPATTKEIENYKWLASLPEFAKFTAKRFGTRTVSLSLVDKSTLDIEKNLSSFSSFSSVDPLNALKKGEADKDLLPFLKVEKRWSVLSLWKDFLDHRLGKVSARDGKFVYLELEDLTASFKRPCVMDIKLGSSQHGSRSSKADHHKKKCAATTSASLGFRVSGSRCFQPLSGKEICRDKYWGRALRPSGVVDAFRLWLTADSAFRTDVCRSLLEECSQLVAVLESHPFLKPWGCSLLLTYEGDPSAVEGQPRVVLVDFANMELEGEGDCDVVTGMRNCCAVLKELLE